MDNYREYNAIMQMALAGAVHRTCMDKKYIVVNNFNPKDYGELALFKAVNWLPSFFGTKVYVNCDLWTKIKLLFKYKTWYKNCKVYETEFNMKELVPMINEIAKSKYDIEMALETIYTEFYA